MGRTKYGFETTSTRSNIMSKIRSKDTKPELKSFGQKVTGIEYIIINYLGNLILYL